MEINGNEPPAVHIEIIDKGVWSCTSSTGFLGQMVRTTPKLRTKYSKMRQRWPASLKVKHETWKRLFRQNIRKLYERWLFFKLLLLFKDRIKFWPTVPNWSFSRFASKHPKVSSFEHALGMMIWSPKDSITTKDLSTVSNSAGSFLKGPVLVWSGKGKSRNKGAAFI